MSATFDALLEMIKKQTGIWETIGTHLVAIIAPSGLTVNPHVADVTEGTGPMYASHLKENYFISTKPQVKTATKAVATHCDIAIVDVKQVICEFGRHTLSVTATEKVSEEQQK